MWAWGFLAAARIGTSIAVLFEKKGHLQINGNRAKGADAEKVRDAVKRHQRVVFWAVFNQKRTFVEGGPGPGRELITLETLQYMERNLVKAKGVAQVLTLLEQGKTDKAATGWEIALQAKPAADE